MQSPSDGFFYQRWSARYSGLYSEQSWKVRNFPLNFQATVRNKPGAKFSRAENSRCEIPPPPPPCMQFFTLDSSKIEVSEKKF